MQILLHRICFAFRFVFFPAKFWKVIVLIGLSMSERLAPMAAAGERGDVFVSNDEHSIHLEEISTSRRRQPPAIANSFSILPNDQKRWAFIDSLSLHTSFLFLQMPIVPLSATFTAEIMKICKSKQPFKISHCHNNLLNA